MKLSKNGLIELAGHEGVVLAPYQDSVGVWTIGIGHTSSAGGIDPATFEGSLTIQEALDLFNRDLVSYEKTVNLVFSNVKLTQEQYDAAVSFHFNTGAIAGAGWVKHFLNGDPYTAENSETSGIMAWRKPPSIISRRRKEKKLFFDGVYSNNGVVSLYQVNSHGQVIWGRSSTLDLGVNKLVSQEPSNVRQYNEKLIVVNQLFDEVEELMFELKEKIKHLY